MPLLSFFHFQPGYARRILLMMLVAATTAALAAPPQATATGSYAVQACMDEDLTYDYPVADGFGGWAAIVSTADDSHRTRDDCAGSLGLYMQLKGADRKANGDFAGWKFAAPTGTWATSASLWFDAYTRPSNGQTQGLFGVRADGVADFLTAERGLGLTTGHVETFQNLHSKWLSAMVYCEAVTGTYDCPTGEDATAMLHRAVVDLSDPLPPVVSMTDGSSLDDRWAGTNDLVFTATDAGSGVAEFRLYVDGSVVQRRTPNDNGGACKADRIEGGVPMYHAPKPCPGSVTASETIDTTAIPDGQHQVDLVVADASGRETSMASGTKLVANHPPVNVTPPAFADLARAAQPHVGDVLQAVNGSWTGPDLTYAVAWERCEADGSACGQIPGALSDTYTLTAADLGRRVRVAVTATNPADSVTSRSALSGEVATLSAPMGDSATSSSDATSTTAAPTLPSDSTGTTDPDHALVGHVAGEPPTATCPQDRAALVLQGVAGRTVKLAYGRRGSVRLALTCAATGKAIVNARLDVAARVGSRPAVASQITTDASGRATLALPRGASRAITVGYRMYADDPLARATVTLRVRVGGRISIRASRRTLRNRQAVTLTGAVAGGHVPRRGVDLAVQWRDGRRWRTFALARTDRRGRYRYAYRFTRTRGTVRYTLRVQVLKGQVDYPFEPVASKAVRLTVRG